MHKRTSKLRDAFDDWDRNRLRPALARGARQATTPPVAASSPSNEPSVDSPRPPLYTPCDDTGRDYLSEIGFPGEYPYTRGIHPSMYTGRLWTMRQYAGFGSAAETHERFRYLLDQGQGGLLVAFDLPTQIGLDSDDPLARGEVGVVGVAVDSLADMETIFRGLPLERASPSLTMNAAASVALAMYLVVAEQEGLRPEQVSGTTQNDILKEYIARGTYIFPPRPSLRLGVDLIEYCSRHLPRWNFINICGYHIREAGATRVQEVAFALANAITYIEACLERGLAIDDFAKRLAFNFTASTEIFPEAAKFRAARRLWAKLLRERFGAQDPASWMWRTGAGSAASTLTAQQPENNIVRVALQALAGILGGVQSFHTAAFDEALALPSEHAALLALRTQQVLAYESGVGEVIDPLGGSHYVEALTDEIETEVRLAIERIEAEGGMLRAIEAGRVQAEIAASAYQQQCQIERGEQVVVGLNRFEDAATQDIELHRPSAAVVETQIRQLKRLRAERDNTRVEATLDTLRDEARGETNLMYPMLDAVKAYATIGEICATLTEVFGEHRAQAGALA
ncbi:MAG: methylmalonyl-CoA mutase [Gammaproteobacteria bacterium]|nr:methylmalonyl-CoA mutase [Gammaproteobacteria bacterium]